MTNLTAADRKMVQKMLVQLPPRTKAAQEKEMGEMMGKLKEVCVMLVPLHFHGVEGLLLMMMGDGLHSSVTAS